MRWAIATGATVIIGVATLLLRGAAVQPAEQRAAQIVDEALLRHELSQEDVEALRRLGPQLREPARAELRMKLVRAVDRQELKLDASAGLP